MVRIVPYVCRRRVQTFRNFQNQRSESSLIGILKFCVVYFVKGNGRKWISVFHCPLFHWNEKRRRVSTVSLIMSKNPLHVTLVHRAKPTLQFIFLLTYSPIYMNSRLEPSSKQKALVERTRKWHSTHSCNNILICISVFHFFLISKLAKNVFTTEGRRLYSLLSRLAHNSQA